MNWLQKIIAFLTKSKQQSTTVNNPVSGNEPRFIPIQAKPAQKGMPAKQIMPLVAVLPNSTMRDMKPRGGQPERRGGAAKLLAEGHFGIGLVGLNDRAFIINHPVSATDLGLPKSIATVPKRVGMTVNRDLALGLRLGLEILERAPQGRAGIVIVTSGAPTTKFAWARELIDTAIARRIGVHVLLLGSDAQAEEILIDLTTKSALGFGSFHVANSGDELVDAIRLALDGLLPAFGMRGTNTGLLLLDCSASMAESFAGSTRMAMVAAALAEYLQNPLARPIQKQLAA